MRPLDCGVVCSVMIIDGKFVTGCLEPGSCILPSKPTCGAVDIKGGVGF
jgi:hypothetical protein